MRPSTALARLGIAVAILACLVMSPIGARANHGADDVYLQQVGNGGGDSVPVIRNFGLNSSLFNGQRFPVCSGATCVERPTFPKHLGFGIINMQIEGTWFLQVARVTGSDDGLRWSAPQQAYLQKPDGRVPFLLGSTATHFDVLYNSLHNTTATPPTYPFSIYYKLAPVACCTNTIDVIHVAHSEDGINWVDDSSITQDAANPLVGGTGTPFTYGPLDVIFQPTGSVSSTCAGATGLTPWNCRVVLLYARTDPAGTGSVQTIGLAGSPNGLNFTAYPGTILSPTAGTWDAGFVGFAGIRIRGTGASKQYTMFYAGGGGSCASFACLNLGVATSTNGINWTKISGAEMTPRQLPNAIGEPANNDTLLNPEPVDDASGTGHSKVFFSRYADQPFPRQMDTYLATTAPAPGAGPSIAISSPASGFRTAKQTPIEVYVTDTLGTNIGVNMASLSMTMDGAPISGVTSEPTTVTSYRFVGKKIEVSGSVLQLADGAHTFAMSIADLDGNVSSRSISFTVDTTAPSTVVTASPAGPALGFPNSVGTFFGTTTDNAGGTGLARVRATVRNPLGQVKTFESNAHGFNITKITTHNWTWNWVAPVLDAHFALPGEYTVSLGGIDLGGAVEGARTANTVTLLVV